MVGKNKNIKADLNHMVACLLNGVNDVFGKYNGGGGTKVISSPFRWEPGSCFIKFHGGLNKVPWPMSGSMPEIVWVRDRSSRSIFGQKS